MNTGILEQEIIVHPIDGRMQLSEGYIRRNSSSRFVGRLPGIDVSEGDTVEEVLTYLNRNAKAYYGDDVVVEIAHRITSG